jgi:hypothetical protein
MMPEGDPGDGAWISAILASSTFAGPADFVSDVSHGAIGSGKKLV